MIGFFIFAILKFKIMTIHYVTRGNKKGVFLSVRDWNAVKKKLETLQSDLESIEKRRREILHNFKRAKKEAHKFSSSVSELKKNLK